MVITAQDTGGFRFFQTDFTTAGTKENEKGPGGGKRAAARSRRELGEVYS